MRSRRVLAALAALDTLATAAPCAAQGTIRVGEINSFSGIGAPFTGPYRQAIEMAVEEVNAKGGVLGRKVEVLFREHGSVVRIGARLFLGGLPRGDDIGRFGEHVAMPVG